MNNQKFKEEFKLLLEKTIFPSDIKDEERSRDWNNIISYIIANVPSKLYRFRAYNDYSVDSLKTILYLWLDQTCFMICMIL